MKLTPLGILPALGLLGWFIATTYLDRSQNRRLDALEHATVTITNVMQVHRQSLNQFMESQVMLSTNITAPLSIPSTTNSR